VISARFLLVEVIKWEVLILLGGMGGTILMHLLTGSIEARNLLWGRRTDGTRYFSPERVQLLVGTIAIALQYLLTAAHTPSGEMPHIPDGALELLGVSNAIYLSGKGWNLFRNRLQGRSNLK
jgi:hypothetical protein